MTTKRTQNWHICTDPLREYHNLPTLIRDANGFAVCELVFANNSKATNNIAGRASLIAAAPELLAALEWALENLDDDLDPDFQVAKTQCEMLVKKARGIESKQSVLNIDKASLTTNESYNLNVFTKIVGAKNRK